MKNLKKKLSKTTRPISKYFGTNGTWVTLYQDCSNYIDPLTNMTPNFPQGGVVSFSYGYKGKTLCVVRETTLAVVVFFLSKYRAHSLDSV